MMRGGVGKLNRNVTRVGAAVLAVLLVAGTALAQSGYQPPHNRPGPASDRIRFRAFHVDVASQELQAGSMDFYQYSLKTEAARDLKGKPGIRMYEAPASTISLVLNPAPAPQGELNPFSIPEVRRAVQYLVNREFIAQEVYKGLGKPMLTHVSPFDYDYLAIADMLSKADISYDPERARQMIADAMKKVGAEQKDGIWQFQGKPIRLRFVIRTEDERREVGDLIRAELEKAGFQVLPSYQQFAPAILAVYGTDPQQFEWHLYTEGWGRGAAERYDYSSLNQFAAPWLGNMPGWQEAGYWQYTNQSLDEIGQRIFRGDFPDRATRDNLYQQATEIALNESVRIWLAVVVNSFPTQDKVAGVTEDVVAGPKSIWTLREAYVPGKDTLTVGSLWVWTERTTWNPVGGFGDVYSSDIWRNLQDPPIARHPFTGLPVPFRVSYDVQTSGPGGKLDVPADAIRWDAGAGQFVPVGSGARATSKVVYDYSKYFQSTWHHGQPITMADVVYSIYQSFDIAYNPKKSQVEFAIATTSKPFLDTYRGFRVLDDNRIEVYIDYWHFEKDYIAEYAVPSSVSMPWEILAAMDDLVFNQRRAAYSDTAAQRFSVPWISLVQDRDARLVERTLREMQERSVFPEAAFRAGGRPLVDVATAKARYQAARDWFNKTGMMIVSSGPYKLTRFDPPAQFAEIEAVRDATYPFKPGDKYFGEAPRVELRRAPSGAFRIGQDTKLPVEVSGPGTLGVRYVLAEPTSGKVIKAGEAESDGQGGGFSIPLTKDETAGLTPGLYRLTLTAYSGDLSSVAERTVNVEASTTAGQPAGPGGAGTQPPAQAPKSGGCSLGGATADVGLMTLLLAGLVTAARTRRRRS